MTGLFVVDNVEYQVVARWQVTFPLSGKLNDAIELEVARVSGTTSYVASLDGAMTRAESRAEAYGRALAWLELADMSGSIVDEVGV